MTIAIAEAPLDSDDKMQDLTDYQFTSESVSEGHPDKVCDRISDTILDLYLEADPYSRVAAETMVSPNSVVIAGETRGPDSVTHDKIETAVRAAIQDIGYDQEGFHHETVDIDIKLHAQSVDIAQGVDEGTGVDKDEGAGDQGIMFGYATNETEALMPAALQYSHSILHDLAQLRKSGELSQLGPDSKSQVTIEYKDDRPIGVRSVVVSTQHDDGLSQNDVREMVIPTIQNVLPDGWMPPAEPHGGGAFSGKDPTKVDRSAAYISRYLAKNVVAAGYAEGCTIQLSYAIGVSKPISVYLNTHGTGTAPEPEIVKALQQLVDLRPRGIREHLQLNRPIYARTAAYGHFGRTPTEDGVFSWEKTDLIDDLRKILG